jgi:hypothetical protein
MSKQSYYEHAKENLNYDSSTGIFTWNKDRTGSAKKGSVAGTITRDGYISIGCKNRRISAHRIAWHMYYGHIPDSADIDHINGIKTDNRIANLRLCNKSQNLCNRPIQKNNKSGYKGVSWCSKLSKWIAQIKKNRKLFYLGSYKAPEDAYLAYTKAAKQLHKEFARL